jgi:hypothetical protein
MKNTALAEIGKILVILSVLNNEIKDLKEQRHSIMRGINNKKLRVLFGEIEEIKYSFEHYKRLKAQNNVLCDQLKRSVEIQRVITQKMFCE